MSLSILWKPQMSVFIVKNASNQWNKAGLDSRYLLYECNDIIGEIFSPSILQKEHKCVFDKPKLYSFLFK